MSASEITKRWVELNHTNHNFWYLYSFTLILISWNRTSTHMFKAWIIFILNKHVWYYFIDFDSLPTTQHIHKPHNKYGSLTKTKILTRRIRICSACCNRQPSHWPTFNFLIVLAKLGQNKTWISPVALKKATMHAQVSFEISDPKKTVAKTVNFGKWFKSNLMNQTYFV